jgi:hypothetical protein
MEHLFDTHFHLDLQKDRAAAIRDVEEKQIFISLYGDYFSFINTGMSPSISDSQGRRGNCYGHVK